ncbi:MAG: hypothetical protein ACI9XO_002436 [Paraglaciecola sp.]|jgi:hypothetical protein
MAGSKLRVTGFTRFLLFMMIVVPAAFIGSSYYNGEDGLQKAKDLVGIGGEKTETVGSNTSTDTGSSTNSTSTAELEDCIDALARMERRLERRDQEIEDLEAKIVALRKGN